MFHICSCVFFSIRQSSSPPPGQHLPPMGRGLLYDPPSRRTPPNKQRIHPAQTRVVRDHTTDGDIEKNSGPVDAQATENDIPPHHREMVTRLASEMETVSYPHYPVKLYKYATQALTQARKSKQRASTHPLEHNTPAPRAESASTHGTSEVPSPEVTPIHSTHAPGTPRPTPPDTPQLTMKTFTERGRTDQHTAVLYIWDEQGTAVGQRCKPKPLQYQSGHEQWLHL